MERALANAWGRRFTALWWDWCAFWFYSPAPARMRLFRVALGSMLFVFYSIRAVDLMLWFSETGIMPLSIVPDMLPMNYRQSIFFYLSSDAAIWIGNAIYLLALALLALGIRPRYSAGVAFILHVSFLHRDMVPSYGVDMIASFFLFYLCFADYAEKRKQSSGRTMLGSMACRLIQIQICIIYAYSGLDKVKGVQWWGGEALWGVVSNVQIARWDFSFVAHFPLLLVAATYSTLAWEIYFPVLIWFKPLRNFMLLFGVALHIGIGLVVNIPFFASIMIISYLVFLDETVAARIWKKLKQAEMLSVIR
ncbi:MAG: HTTM domain-containing protein [Deltaproteobacteria bacterium]|nr:HTTM domain-containing protein [Deltaproteobacteria bacterium]